MKINHHISLSVSSEDCKALSRMGVEVKEGFHGFDVDEEHKHWLELSEWIKKRKAVDMVYTIFTKNEIAKVDWLQIVPEWHYGYPQPHEDEFGHHEATYDLSDYCSKCGIGLVQKAPFQMKNEPKWGGNRILQMNWVFDEFFVTPEVWKSIFKPYDIMCRPVINRKGIELETVVQLVVEQEHSIFTENLANEKCPSCGRVKYLPVVRGYFPNLKDEPSISIVKTKEYFGSGARAYKKILISQKHAKTLEKAKVRGVKVKP